jgi:DHA2 family methylenomycin A resistance protein-like MFS transporter
MHNFPTDDRQFRDAHPVAGAIELQDRAARRWAKPLTLAAMSLGYCVVQLDVTIVNTALATIGNALGGGVAELQWVVTTYTLSPSRLLFSAPARLATASGQRRFLSPGSASSQRRRSPVR